MGLKGRGKDGLSRRNLQMLETETRKYFDRERREIRFLILFTFGKLVFKNMKYGNSSRLLKDEGRPPATPQISEGE